MPKIIHKGLRTDRLEDPLNAREKAFAERWERENKETVFLNPPLGSVKGRLQSLLYKDGQQAHEVTQRDAEIAATVVQWFGSNVGFEMVRECLKEAGYQITYKGEER